MSHGLTLDQIVSIPQSERLILLDALEGVKAENRLQHIEDMCVAFRGGPESKGYMAELIKVAYEHDHHQLAIRLEAATRKGS